MFLFPGSFEVGGVGLRAFLVGILAFVLLFWGPLLGGGWARSYVIALPIAFWFVLAYVWRVWQPDAAAEDQLQRTVAAAVGGAFLLSAILLLESADFTQAFILLAFVLFAFVYPHIGLDGGLPRG